jgi:hypothetical protein
MPAIIGIVYSNLLFSAGIAPKVSEGQNAVKAQSAVNAISERSCLHRLLLEQATLASAIGDIVFETYLRDGKAYIEATDPSFYFPIYGDAGRLNRKTVLLAWPEKRGPRGDQKEYLRVKLFMLGRLEHQAWRIESGRIGERIENLSAFEIAREIEAIPTSEIPVQHVPNLTFGGRWGIADIGMGVDGLIDELDNRLSQNSSILDKHAAPDMFGSEEYQDEYPSAGQVAVTKRGGRFWPMRDKESPVPGYLTWNGNLEPAKEQMNRVITLIALATGLPPSMFLPEILGSDQSAKRLRLEFFMAMDKCSRKRLYFDPALKSILLAAQELEAGAGGYTALPITDLGWRDGLPDDYNQAVLTETARVDAGLETRADAIMQLDRCDEAAARQKLAEIEKEQTARREDAVDRLRNMTPASVVALRASEKENNDAVA